MFAPPDEGSGLLSAKVLWAGIVGPHRLAMARRTSLRITNTEARSIYKNLGAAEAVVFVGVSLPGNYQGNPIITAFGSSDMLGANTGSPGTLVTQMGGGGLSVSGFMQILLPGEQLYAQIVDPTFGGGEQNVVVANVTF